MITDVQAKILSDYERDDGRFLSTFAEWNEERPKLRELGLLAARPNSVISQITEAGRNALLDFARETAGKGRTT